VREDRHRFPSLRRARLCHGMAGLREGALYSQWQLRGLERAVRDDCFPALQRWRLHQPLSLRLGGLGLHLSTRSNSKLHHPPGLSNLGRTLRRTIRLEPELAPVSTGHLGMTMEAWV
jgi:hypothetical protein